ncbi:hypothetical protein, partial [Mycobacteroides abscessus]
MRGVVAIAYAVISYVLFLASFLYLIAFVGNMMVPCTIDNGLPAPTLEALVVDGVNRPGNPGGSGYWISTRVWSVRW